MVHVGQVFLAEPLNQSERLVDDHSVETVTFRYCNNYSNVKQVFYISFCLSVVLKFLFRKFCNSTSDFIFITMTQGNRKFVEKRDLQNGKYDLQEG